MSSGVAVLLCGAGLHFCPPTVGTRLGSSLLPWDLTSNRSPYLNTVFLCSSPTTSQKLVSWSIPGEELSGCEGVFIESDQLCMMERETVLWKVRGKLGMPTLVVSYVYDFDRARGYNVGAKVSASAIDFRTCAVLAIHSLLRAVL